MVFYMKKFFVLLAASVMMFCGCEFPTTERLGNQQKISVVTWNVQTFFDSQKDGCEYADFIKNENWDSKMYFQRLERLCKVMLELDADVYVLQEIENSDVIYDVCNQLTQKSWNSKDGWAYSCFYKIEGSSIGCGVISKYQLQDLTTHMIDIRTDFCEQPDMRAIMKVNVLVGEKKLCMFVNHWKSKSGDETGTEKWRNFQEALLASQVLDCNECGIICGDFNRDIREFNLICGDDSGKNVQLQGKFLKGDNAFVYTPWIDETGDYTCEIGSYFYKNSWERIDNIFSFGDAKILSFEPCVDPMWTNEKGIPVSYKIYTGEGYSDHLPLKACVLF